jgi:hypothetical protein
VSVVVRYLGGFGNNLFQYVCARLFAMENNLRLLTEFNHQAVLPMTHFEGGTPVEGPLIQIGEGWTPLAHPYSLNNYEFLGYFQKGSWYAPRREKIESFAKPIPMERNTKDIVMHLRLGDFRQCHIAIHPSWYLGILEKEFQPGRRLFIVTNEPDQDYLSHFSKYSPHVVCTTYGFDWNYLRRFETMISSNSTFCWWAAFFSRPKTLYTFKRWIGNVDMELDVLDNQIIVDGRFLHE